MKYLLSIIFIIFLSACSDKVPECSNEDNKSKLNL